jgi:hypothetical protein
MGAIAMVTALSAVPIIAMYPSLAILRARLVPVVAPIVEDAELDLTYVDTARLVPLFTASPRPPAPRLRASRAAV